MKKKIGILGSRKLACELTEWIAKQNNVEIIGIVPPPFKGWWEDKLENVALKNKLPVFDSIDKLIDNNPDIVFSFNYWKKIEKHQIDLVPEGIINIHHSYLLKYKGRYSTSWAIVNARKLNCWLHGTTLHYIDDKLDEGKIIASYKCEIAEVDTAELLFEKVEQLSIQMFKDYFKPIVENKITSFLNSDTTSFYYDKDSNKNLKIEYGIPLEELYDFVRAWSFANRPKPYIEVNGNKIYLSLKP
jgi:methionyl-tRNA formyltransferase